MFLKKSLSDLFLDQFWPEKGSEIAIDVSHTCGQNFKWPIYIPILTRKIDYLHT